MSAKAKAREALFTRDGAAFRATAHTAGPWDASAQHGSAPAVLITHVAERWPAPAPMRVARVTLDLMRPVPVGELAIDVETVREGRKIQVLAMTLSSGGKPCVRASVLRVRRAEVALPERTAALAPDVPPPGQCPQRASPGNSGFVSGLEMRLARGGGAMTGAGASAVWFRLTRPVIAGEAVSPAERAAVAADFCNGISSMLAFQDWMFINADLSFNLSRDPVGEWVLLDAVTLYGPDGAATAHAGMADLNGWFGRSVQSLVVEPR